MSAPQILIGPFSSSHLKTKAWEVGTSSRHDCSISFNQLLDCSSVCTSMHVTRMRSAFQSVLPISLLFTKHSASGLDASWHPPNKTPINNLDGALHDEGVYGFIFDSSDTPDADYGKYNWCNMPHVRRREYPTTSNDYQLQYVEVVCQHTDEISKAEPHGSWC
jgi:hypothetical protein